MRKVVNFLLLAFVVLVAYCTVEDISYCVSGHSVEYKLRQAFHHAPITEAPHFDTPRQARMAAVSHIQRYSDYIGFEGRFEMAGDDGTTLHMTGSSMCSADFDISIPPEAWAPVKSSGFKYFSCEYKDTWVKMEVR